MTNNTKNQWAAPKLQRLSAKLAENGQPAAINDNGNNQKS